MSGGKAAIASRLFGSAVAGVKDPKQRVSKASEASDKPAAEPRAAPAVQKRDVAMAAGQDGKKARGRGTTAFGSADGAGMRYAGERENVEWRAGGEAPSWDRGSGADSGRWQHDHFEDGPGPRRRGRRNRGSEPYGGGGGGGLDRESDDRGPAERRPMTFEDHLPRWENDRYDGPGTVGSEVFVRNLPMEVAEAAILEELFGGVGEVVSVQVDPGALATATIGYVRQDAAEEAERRYHGRWVHGCQIKVSAKARARADDGGGDEDFWRKELKAMPRRSAQARGARWGDDYDMGGPPRRGPIRGGGDRVRGRGSSALGGGRVSIFDRMG